MAEPNLKTQLDQALKTALLGGDSFTATAIRGLKSAILYAEVAANKRDPGLSDDEIIVLFYKEAKKRQESADFYVQGKSQERADNELREKALIESFLPAQLSDEDLFAAVDEAISANPGAQMGQLIGAVKQKLGASVDGSRIAGAVKQRLAA